VSRTGGGQFPGLEELTRCVRVLVGRHWTGDHPTDGWHIHARQRPEVVWRLDQRKLVVPAP
jgi:hypothetical protein